MDTAFPIVTYTYDPKGKLTSITTDGVTEKADCTSALDWKSYEAKPMEPHSLVVTYNFDAHPELRAIFRPDGTVENLDIPPVQPAMPEKEPEEG